MSSDGTCICCQIVQTLEPSEVLELNEHWTVNVAENASTRPWLVVQSKEHYANLSDLSDAARASLGSALDVVTGHALAVSGGRRAYAMLLNEAEPPHVHFHVTVSFEEDEPSKRGSMLLGTETPEGISVNSHQVLDKIRTSIESGRLETESNAVDLGAAEPSFLVRAVVSVVRNFQRHNLHAVVRSLFDDRGLSTTIESHSRSTIRSSFAEIWVGGWVLTLAALLFLSDVESGPLVVIAVVLALYRLIEIAAPHLVTLLDRTATGVVSFERSFVLVVLNVLELAFILAILLATQVDGGPGERFTVGLRLATLRGELDQGDVTLAAIEWLGTAWSLLLLVASASIAMGRIAERLVERADYA